MSKEAEKMAAEYRERRDRFLAQWAEQDFGPEIAAISVAAKIQHGSLRHFDNLRKSADKVRSGEISPTEIPYPYLYDKHFDYETLVLDHLQNHVGLRHALLVGLGARHPEFNALERDWLADVLSGREVLAVA